jgi:hypothetical protein
MRVDGQVMYAIKSLLFLKTFRHNVQSAGYQKFERFTISTKRYIAE